MGVVYFPHSLFAASLSVSPATGTYSVGDTFTVSALVNTENKAVNAVSGTLYYPANMLDLISISRATSIMNVWTVVPVLQIGTDENDIPFEGVILNPGYTGSSGVIFTATFQVKASGQAALYYNASAILANDGFATNLLEGQYQGVYTFLGGTANPPAVIPPSSEETPTQTLPKAPVISSTTNPNPELWYSNRIPMFVWDTPDDAIHVAFSIDHNPTSVPPASTNGPISSHDAAPGLSDGIWFAHARIKNALGWGPTGHFKVRVDTTPPVFTVNELSQADSPKKVLSFHAEDARSGVFGFTLSFDRGAPITIPATGADTLYTSDVLHPGSHTLDVQALDNAGNSMGASLTFVINPLTSPSLIEYPRSMYVGDLFSVAGTTYPNAHIHFLLTRTSKKICCHADLAEPLVYTAESVVDTTGHFTFTFPKTFLYGTYAFSARVTDASGRESLPTDSVLIQVNEHFIGWVWNFVTSVCMLIFLLVLSILIILLCIYLYLRSHKRAKDEEVAKMAVIPPARIDPSL